MEKYNTDHLAQAVLGLRDSIDKRVVEERNYRRLARTSRSKGWHLRAAQHEENAEAARYTIEVWSEAERLLKETIHAQTSSSEVSVAT